MMRGPLLPGSYNRSRALTAPAITNDMIGSVRFSINLQDATTAFVVLIFHAGLTCIAASEELCG
jgi:hypothetical protein